MVDESICPHCGAKDFDGHCIKCGKRNYEETGTLIKKNCKKCNQIILIWKFKGDSLQGKQGRIYLCENCNSTWENEQEVRDKWAREYGYLKSDPKRINQKRNFDKWCEGERVA